MFTVIFWKDAAERAVKTAAQAIIVLWGSSQLNLFDVDFGQTAGVAAGMAAVSVLTSIASEKIGTPDTASLVKGE